MKPMVKATMPTVKAETRKTCDTEPAAGGIARTMTLARERTELALTQKRVRDAVLRGRGAADAVHCAIRKRSRSPGHRRCAYCSLWRALEKKSVPTSSRLEFYVTLRLGMRRGDRRSRRDEHIH